MKIDISKSLRVQRAKKRWSQSYICDMIGVSQSRYSNWENGYCEPSIDYLVKLAFIYKITLDELVKS